MTKIPKAKAALAAKLRRETEEFLAAGGTIQKIPFGTLTQPAGFKKPRSSANTNGEPMRIHHWRTGELR